MDESQSAPAQTTFEGEPAKFIFTSPPPAVGCWRFGNITLYCTKRPRWLTRFLMKLLVQWQWEDVA